MGTGGTALSDRWQAIEGRLAVLEKSFLATTGGPSAQLALRQAAILARITRILAKAGLSDKDLALPSAATAAPQLAAAAKPAGPPPDDASETHKRLHAELVRLGFTAFSFVRVPADYYDQPLSYRQACLSAASTHHLCKSIVAENTRLHPSVLHEDPLHPSNWANPNNSRYYIIIVQYEARLNFEKVKTHVHRLNEGKVGKQFFNIRLAPEEVSDALTGFTHNGVSPVGCKVQLPIIMSHRIAELTPAFFWMGGGEVDLKLGVRTEEFVRLVQPMVADITY